MRLLGIVPALTVITLLACCGGNKNAPRPSPPGVADLPSNAPPETAGPAASPSPERACVDLNTADADQLATLPGIGEGLAARIIEYREQHGPFRRPQDIIIINGFGERRYHKLESLVCAH